MKQKQRAAVTGTIGWVGLGAAGVGVGEEGLIWGVFLKDS